MFPRRKALSPTPRENRNGFRKATTMSDCGGMSPRTGASESYVVVAVVAGAEVADVDGLLSPEDEAGAAAGAVAGVAASEVFVVSFLSARESVR